MNEINKFKELLKENEFSEKLFALESDTEIQSFLKEYGIELTLEEINKTKELLQKYQNNSLSKEEQEILEKYQKSEELTDADLEAVNGGIVISLGTVAAIAATLIAGAFQAHIFSRGRW